MRNGTLQVQTLQLLLELAKGLGELQKDPKALQKAIEQSYSYDEEMQRKVTEANSLIEKASLIQADIDKQKAALADVNTATAKLESLDAKIKSDKAELKREETALNKRESAIKMAEAEVLKSQNAIAARESQIAQKEASLLAREESIATIEKELKEKADKIKMLVA